jgi:thiol:disulfide interchange protein DsbC
VRGNWTLLKWMVVPAGLALATAQADAPQPLTKEALAKKLPGVEASDITDSPVPGLYQVAVGSDIAYVTQDGRYVLQGELYDAATSKNLTEATRAKARVDMLATIDRNHMIVYGPKDGKIKHTITVFTDIDCGYCRQFHRDIDKVTALGIEVHYLFFPRTGPNTESWTKAEEVWCAKDRKTALTRAKLGGELQGTKCADNPVEAQWLLGQRLGVRGTPAVFSETGELLGGYLTPSALEKRLDEEDSKVAAN